MLCMTVLSALEALKESNIDGEILVVENSDEDVHLAAMACLAGQIKEGNVRVLREKHPSISLAIHRCHSEARGKYLFYTDAHTLIGHGTISALLDFMARHAKEKIGFVYAPIQWAHSSKATKRTHFNVSTCRLGQWGGSKPVEMEQRVPWKGMPYMIEKSVWDAISGLGCCAEHKIGWGVLPYLGIKTWVMGYENWAIPDGVVYHFGEWPEIVRPHAKYRTYSNGGIHVGAGRAVALYVFGGEHVVRDEYRKSKSFAAHFKSEDTAVELAKKIGGEEKARFDALGYEKLDALLARKPWAEDQFDTISPQYRTLNAELHNDPSVKYGYKGHDQAGKVMELIAEFECADALDYGAGKKTLSKALKETGFEAIKDFDPAIPEISAPPEPADLVICSDVLEHIEPEYLDRVLFHIRSLCKKAVFFRVCMIPCTSKSLPDGTDPHKLVHDYDWWKAKIESIFSINRVVEMNDSYFSIVVTPA